MTLYRTSGQLSNLSRIRLGDQVEIARKMYIVGSHFLEQANGPNDEMFKTMNIQKFLFSRERFGFDPQFVGDAPMYNGDWAAALRLAYGLLKLSELLGLNPHKKRPNAPAISSEIIIFKNSAQSREMPYSELPSNSFYIGTNNQGKRQFVKNNPASMNAQGLGLRYSDLLIRNGRQHLGYSTEIPNDTSAPPRGGMLNDMSSRLREYSTMYAAAYSQDSRPTMSRADALRRANGEGRSPMERELLFRHYFEGMPLPPGIGREIAANVPAPGNRRSPTDPRTIHIRRAYGANQYTNKTTSKNTIRIGFEIEKESKTPVDTNEVEPRGWTIERDSSIDERIGYELKSPILPLDNLEKVFKEIDSMEQYINATHSSKCGGHIHVSARDVRPIDLFQRMLGYEALLLAMYPARARNKKYCKLKQHKEYIGNPDHHDAITYRGNTVEIRIFPSPKNVKVLKFRTKFLNFATTNAATSVKDVVKWAREDGHPFRTIMLTAYSPTGLEKRLKLALEIEKKKEVPINDQTVETYMKTLPLDDLHDKFSIAKTMLRTQSILDTQKLVEGLKGASTV